MSQNYTPIEHESGPFKTFDLGLAVSLITLGFELSGMERANAKRFLFVFNQSNEKLREAVNAYVADQLELRARSYFDNLRAVKNRLHDAS